MRISIVYCTTGVMYCGTIHCNGVVLMGGMYVLVGENPVPQYMKSHVLFMCKLTHSPLESGPSVTHGPMNPSICVY